MADLVVRAFGWVTNRAEDGADGLEFEGYASVFGARYAVVDWDGEYDEVVERGAFKKTIAEQGGRVRLLLEHGHHPLVGRLPLGSIDVLREDDHGLLVRARLHDNWMVKPVADAIRSGAVSEMSIGFRPIRETWEEPTRRGEARVRRLNEVALREVSAVVWGASSTTEAKVRGWVDAMPSLLRSATIGAVQRADVTDPCPGCGSMARIDTSESAADGTDEGAVSGAEPTGLVTRQERRRMALVLREVTREQVGVAAGEAR